MCVRQERAPTIDVLTDLLLDRFSVNLGTIDALVGGDRFEQLFASRLAGPAFRDEGIELSAYSDGLHQIGDFAIDGVEFCSQATHISRGRARLKSGDYVIDNSHNDSPAKHISGQSLEHRVVDAMHWNLEPVPAYRRPALVVREASVCVSSRAAVAAARHGEDSATDSATGESREQVP